jgi:hypothetical protein
MQNEQGTYLEFYKLQGSNGESPFKDMLQQVSDEIDAGKGSPQCTLTFFALSVVIYSLIFD